MTDDQVNRVGELGVSSIEPIEQTVFDDLFSIQQKIDFKNQKSIFLKNAKI